MVRYLFLCLVIILTGCTHADSVGFHRRRPSFVTELTDQKNSLEQVSRRSISSVECKFIKELPENFEFGFLDVPEDKRESSGPKLRIFYYTYRPKGSNPNATPILFFNGGPGVDSHGSFRTMMAEVGFLNVPFTFFDYRGVGCSSQYPDFSANNFARLKKYYSKYIADDAEFLKEHIYREKKVIAFGHSYGAKLALRYAEQYPDSIKGVAFMGDSAYGSKELDMATMLNDAKGDTAVSNELYRKWRAENLEASDAIDRIIVSDLDGSICFPTGDAVARTCGLESFFGLSTYLYSEQGRKKLAQYLESFNVDDEAEIRKQAKFISNYTLRSYSPQSFIVREQDYPAAIDPICERFNANRPGTNPFSPCIFDQIKKRTISDVKISPDPVVWEKVLSALRSLKDASVVQFIGCWDAKVGNVDGKCKNDEIATPQKIVTIKLPTDHNGLLVSKELWLKLTQMANHD